MEVGEIAVELVERKTWWGKWRWILGGIWWNLREMTVASRWNLVESRGISPTSDYAAPMSLFAGDGTASNVGAFNPRPDRRVPAIALLLGELGLEESLREAECEEVSPPVRSRKRQAHLPASSA